MRSQSPLIDDSKEPIGNYRVVFRYVPKHDDELSLSEGDIVEALREVEEGWWKGVLNGKIGMFPSNFVEEIEEPVPDIKINELNGNSVKPCLKDQSTIKNGSSGGQFSPTIGSSPNSAFRPIQSKKEERESKNEYVDDSSVSNKTDKSKGKKNHSNSVDKDRQSYEKDKITISIGEEVNRKDKEAPTRVPSVVDIIPPQLPPKPVRELARVVFPYSPDHDDELELKEGEIITVICKELDDKGWWKGEINGKLGVFPDNFVELCTIDEMVKPPRPEKRPSAMSKPNQLPETSTDNKDIAQSPATQSVKKSPTLGCTTKRTVIGSSSFSNVSKDSTDGDESLTLDREHHLNHQTQNRPKGPSNRRPPSQTFLDGQRKHSVSEDEDEVKTSAENSKLKSPSSAEVPWMKELKANQMKKKLTGNPTANSSLSSVDSPQSSTADIPSVRANPRRRSDPHSSFTPPTKTRTSAITSVKNDTIPSVASPYSTNGFNEDSYASHVEYEHMLNKIRAEFRPQIKKLEERLNEQQQRHSRQLLMLMDELGDERQKIACLQIDIDRLTKLSSSDANV